MTYQFAYVCADPDGDGVCGAFARCDDLPTQQTESLAIPSSTTSTSTVRKIQESSPSQPQPAAQHQQGRSLQQQNGPIGPQSIQE